MRNKTRCMDYPMNLPVGASLKIAGSYYTVTSKKEQLDGSYAIYASEEHYESVIWMTVQPNQLIENYVVLREI